MTEQNLTVRDIILGIATSILGTILYQLGYRGLVYIRSERFRKIRKRIIRNATAIVTSELALIRPQFVGLQMVRVPIATFILMITILTLWFFLSQSKRVPVRPELASPDLRVPAREYSLTASDTDSLPFVKQRLTRRVKPERKERLFSEYKLTHQPVDNGHQLNISREQAVLIPTESLR